MTLLYCSGIKIPIFTRAKGLKTDLPIYLAEAIKLKLHCRQLINISSYRGSCLELLAQDLLYTPLQQDSFTSFTHLVHSNCSAVLVENNSVAQITIPTNTLLGHIADTKYNSIVVVIEANVYYLTAVPTKKLS